MIYVKAVEPVAGSDKYKEVDRSELTDLGIGMAIQDCYNLIDSLEDARQEMIARGEI